MSMQQLVKQTFEEKFSATPAFVVRAPGRVNLIGEHTDYNEGFVLPMAIDRAVWISARPRQDNKVILYSLDFDEMAEFALNNLQRRKTGWLEYIEGTAWALQEAGYTLRGWEGVVAGDVPIGAGLSSSAALELASARAFAVVSAIDWDAPEMAKIAQRAENQWVSVNCGIMDQMISASGKANHALLIDCRTLETEPVPLPPNTAIVVLDTNTRRGLVDSAYNERRAQCEAAAQFFGVRFLRDVDQQHFEEKANLLDEVICKRARHVITENARTLLAREAMLQADAVRLGQLMDASHISLRDDFEVSSEALNCIVECARQHEACYGARMTGGGFGGCAVALVDNAAARDFAAYVTDCYQEKANLNPNIYICEATNGAEVVKET